MATSALHPLLFLALSLLAVSVSGRPCKTLFFYTTSTSYFPTTTPTGATSFPQNPNPTFSTFPFQGDLSYSPKFLTLFFATANGREDVGNRPPIRLHFRPKFVSLRRYPFPIHTNGKELYGEEQEEEGDVEKRLATSTMPLGFYSTVTKSSIRDRTRDIMSVVGALLFGFGCGALTAASMYLIWSLFSPNRFDFDDSDDDGLDDIDDDGASPKRMGYVTVPDEDIDAVKKAAQAQAKANEAAQAQAPAKEAA